MRSVSYARIYVFLPQILAYRATMVWGLGKDSTAFDLLESTVLLLHAKGQAANHTVSTGPGVKERQ